MTKAEVEQAAKGDRRAMKRMLITVRGLRKEWTFTFYGEPEWLDEWRADGLEIYIVDAMFPHWVAALGAPAIRAWTFMARLLSFRWFS